MQNKVKIKISSLLMILFLCTGCNSNEREFFSEVGNEKVEFDSLNWWRIDIEASGSFMEKPVYKTEINILKFQIAGFSFYDKGAFSFCEEKPLENCERIFDFSLRPSQGYTLRDGSKVRLLSKDSGIYFFELTETGIYNDTGYTNTSLWALSKQEGIVGVAYYEVATCSYIKISSINSEIFDKVKNSICKSFDAKSASTL